MRNFAKNVLIIIFTLHFSNSALNAQEVNLKQWNTSETIFYKENWFHNPISTSYEWTATISDNPLFEAVKTNFYSDKFISISSEYTLEQNLFGDLQFELGVNYSHGRDNPLLTIQNYIPNTSEIGVYGALQYPLSASLSVEINYQWNNELEIAREPTFAISGPILGTVSITYEFGNWSFSAAALRISNLPWDGVIFEIENQELGEIQAPEEVVFRPNRSLSGQLSASFSF